MEDWLKEQGLNKLNIGKKQKGKQAQRAAQSSGAATSYMTYLSKDGQLGSVRLAGRARERPLRGGPDTNQTKIAGLREGKGRLRNVITDVELLHRY